MTATFKILGITDAITVCDCCGKSNLKCTVELEGEDGEIVNYGRDCAGKAIYGRKSAKNTSVTEDRARMIQRCRDILPSVLEAIKDGVDREAVKKMFDYRYSITFGVYSDTGNKMPLRIYWNGWTVPGVNLEPSAY